MSNIDASIIKYRQTDDIIVKRIMVSKKIRLERGASVIVGGTHNDKLVGLEKIANLEASVHEKDEKIKRLEEQLTTTADANKKLIEKINVYENADPSTLSFCEGDIKTFENMLKYIRSCAGMPQSIASKSKALEKQSKAIASYQENSNGLLKACKPFFYFFISEIIPKYNNDLKSVCLSPIQGTANISSMVDKIGLPEI